MMDNEFLCPICGGLTEKINEGRTIGTRCTQCGWSVVSTYTPPIDEDSTLYEVRVKKSNHPDGNQIKTIASLGGINFLQARKQIIEGEFIFRGKARQILSVRERLGNVNLSFEINPVFKW